MAKEFHSLLSLEEARASVMSRLPAVSVETVSLADATGRILSERLVSRIDVPAFSRASMDGYAVRAADTFNAREDRPAVLRLEGRVLTGSVPDVVVDPCAAAEVSTGSMMPDGSDAVVMVEYSDERDGSLLVRRPVHAGENILSAGSDISAGETLLLAGTRLGPREIGVLAAAGIDRVCVRSLVVGVASTGSELASPGSALGPAQVFDTNTHTIASAVQECGATPRIYGILPDDRKLLRDCLKRAACECSMVLCSGSTSAGAGDILYEIIAELGELIFHGINLKPGKPTIFGVVGNRPIIGLPGYPTSALTVFSLLVEPAIREALGLRVTAQTASARLARPLRSESRRQMLAVGLLRGRAYAVDRGSGAITTLARADGIIEIPPEREYLDRGELVEVRLLSDPMIEPDLVVSGESCPVLQRMIDSMQERMHLRIRYNPTGSVHGMSDVEDGLADIACVSSLSEAPVKIPEGFVMIPGYTRDLGLAARNPETLDMPAARVAGWSRGTGIAKSFERYMKGTAPCCQAKTHESAVATVTSGRADIAFVARAAAEAAGFYFRKLGSDRIDFLVLETTHGSAHVRGFMEALGTMTSIQR